MPQDYYAILEIAPDADLTVIKSQYRKLVRLNHPDIAADKETAHARMQLILEAYNVLSDVEKRASYDRSRNAPLPLTPRATGPGMRRHTPSSMSRPGGRSTYGGGGQTNASRNRAEWSDQAPASSSTNPRTRLLTMVFEAANLYFENGRAGEAIAICERVMKSDASNAEAPALLGDIYADQGKNDLALAMYERAMRRRPDNLSYRQKYESLKGSVPANGAAKGKPKAKSLGCGPKVLFWLFVVALTPVLIELLAQP
ncbi:MAG TPA: DnaJ domain-containing protein [Abditibacteriaceae bacterium]|jgi:curved DNA-binding protein CbpA